MLVTDQDNNHLVHLQNKRIYINIPGASILLVGLYQKRDFKLCYFVAKDEMVLMNLYIRLSLLSAF